VSPLDAALVRRKLATIARNLGDLATVSALTLDEYRRDRFRQKGIERLLQETIEAAVDANQHLLREVARAPAQDYHASFVALGDADIVPAALAAALAPAAGMRNRLVHEYDVIDDAIVLAAVGVAVRDFGAYVHAVERFLDTRGAERA
jgi:uncharacterized protein YutE (UPF0331/DUF86 family)